MAGNGEAVSFQPLELMAITVSITMAVEEDLVPGEVIVGPYTGALTIAKEYAGSVAVVKEYTGEITIEPA
jgi:hypothetical protein